jgi:uncharacterized protein
MPVTTAISDLGQMLATLAPHLHVEPVVYVALPPGVPPEVGWDDAGLIGAFREAEGWTLILQGDGAGLEVLFEAAWITLTVHSDLAAVGLTAAFAAALGAAGISCNVIAAACHDHIFVPPSDAARAMQALQDLQARHAMGRGVGHV